MIITYLRLLSVSWQNGLVYRVNLLLWRARQILSTVMALAIWNAVYLNTSNFSGYDRSQMLTYILVVAVLQNIILSTVLQGLTTTIYNGQLTHELLKPINIYVWFAIQDLADKLKNLVFILIENSILFWLIQPNLIWPSPEVWLMTGLLTMGGVSLHFLIQLLLGALGFWSPDSWAPRFLFFMIIELVAGRFFPLNILPASIQRLVSWTPMPYLAFVQSQAFLGKISPAEVVNHLGWLGLWMLILGLLVRKLWTAGLKNYEATGR